MSTEELLAERDALAQKLADEQAWARRLPPVNPRVYELEATLKMAAERLKKVEAERDDLRSERDKLVVDRDKLITCASPSLLQKALETAIDRIEHHRFDNKLLREELQDTRDKVEMTIDEVRRESAALSMQLSEARQQLEALKLLYETLYRERS